MSLPIKAWGRRRCGRFVVVFCWVLTTLPVPAAEIAERDLVFAEEFEQSLSGELGPKQGRVYYHPFQRKEVPAPEKQQLTTGDSLRTALSASASVLFIDRTDVLMRELSRLRIVPPPTTGRGGRQISIQEGSVYVRHAGRPLQGALNIVVPSGRIAPRGTEFLVSVNPDDNRAEVILFDGEALVTTETTNATVRTGEQGIILAGGQVQIRPVIEATNIVQWWIYYPGVLDAGELKLSPEERQPLQDSLEAYRLGDLLEALERFPGYPDPEPPASADQRAYLAGLLLAVGSVDRAEKLLAGLNTPPANALRVMIASVTGKTGRNGTDPGVKTASERMAWSYHHQALHDLDRALETARGAVEASPRFALGWARVAELEFGFGRIRRARAALERAVELGPRNAQAHALNGFLLAARNQSKRAIAAFDRAIALDPALGNGWLGRGLVKRRLARTQITDLDPVDSSYGDWLSDLRTATSVEPSRSLLHSYLGKAFAEQRDTAAAVQELDYAARLDPHDATPSLYSALLNQRNNRVNEAIEDLERSQRLTGNRGVYRSRLLLDEDSAVGGANLARIYQDAGMTEQAVQEAAIAINTDYANYASHLFLANSYDRLRDPNQIDLRYESAWLSEYLVANLLAPSRAGTLSPTISQQEYSQLFERNRLGIVTSTEYQSTGDWLQSGSQYGRIGSFAYALEGSYQSRAGSATNRDLEQHTLSTQFKQEITANDSIYLQAIYYNAEGGDLRRYYDPALEVDPDLRFEEEQEPILFAGYHRHWSPGQDTLLLGGWGRDRFHLVNPEQAIPSVSISVFGTTNLSSTTMDERLRSNYEIYSIELQHSARWHRQGLVAGFRYQTGDISSQSDPVNLSGVLPTDPRSRANVDIDRVTAYAYYDWQVIPSIQLVGGIAFDRLRHPRNFNSSPLTSLEDTREQFGLKGGLLWTPSVNTRFRAAYAKSLGGFSFDQSFRLEPTQVAGFNQAFRNLIPESLAGSIPGAELESWNIAFNRKFPSRTYLSVGAELLKSTADRAVGAFITSGFPPIRTTTVLDQDLDYREQSASLSLHQLVGDYWSFGASYRVSKAELETAFPALPQAVATGPTRSRSSSLLHDSRLFSAFSSPSGLFSTLELRWIVQDSSDSQAERPRERLAQLNLFGGYRFAHRRAEMVLGFLNLTDQDYRFSPLNLYQQLPRDRTLTIQVRLLL